MHQSLLNALRVFDLGVHHRLRELLHFLGKLGDAVELHHLQSAVHLVDVSETGAHVCGVRRIRIGFQRLTRMFKRGLDLALDPIKSYIVPTLSHPLRFAVRKILTPLTSRSRCRPPWVR